MDTQKFEDYETIELPEDNVEEMGKASHLTRGMWGWKYEPSIVPHRL